MQTLHQFQRLFDEYLNEHPFTGQPVELYVPVNYILSLGGKRLRPAILMMSYYLFDEEVKKSLPAAFAVEVFHNFTLLHDDIMDAAPLRRGKPTVHIAYGLNTGILSGDVMMVCALESLQRIEDKSRFQALLSTFTQTAIEVCEGQQLDMNFEARQDVTIREYLRMIELKTSVLLAGAVKMGAQLAGASEPDAQSLYEFGRNLGIAFQLQDDLLDTYGDPGKVGKRVGGDIAKNKKTFLFLKAVELANEGLRTQLRRLYSSPAEDDAAKIKTVISIFDGLGIRQQSERIKEEYRKEAFTHLQKVSVGGKKKALIESFAQALMEREF